MKPRIFISIIVLFTVLLTACELPDPSVNVPQVEGREPEVITWISGQQWFPANIALLIQDTEDGMILHLEANSSVNKGWMRSLRLDITDQELEWPPQDTLNLWETTLPTTVSVEYEQFRDKNNLYSSLWFGDQNNLGGLKINGLEEENGIVYAAGEFFMTPYAFVQRPDIRNIEGIFNNVRVFHNQEDMQAYFTKLAALEATGR